MQLVVRHPSPVLGTPKGKRTPAWGFARIATPAEVTVLEPGVIQPLGRVPDFAPDLHKGEDGLWTRLSRRVTRPNLPFHPKREPIGADEFVSWLGAERIEVGNGEADLAHALAGTPLAAAWQVARAPEKGMVRHEWDEILSGGEPDEAGDRRTFDDRERSSAALARFLAEEIRICGDGVFLRADLVARPSSLRMYLGLASARTMAAGSVPYLRPDLADAFLAPVAPGWMVSSRYLEEPDPRLGRFLARLPAGAIGDWDLRLHANALPVAACTYVDMAQRKGLPVAPPSDALRIQSMRGRIGGVLPEEYATTAQASLDAMRALCAESRVRDRLYVRPLDEQTAFLETYVMPRLRAGPELCVDDAENLAGLAP